MRTQVKKHQIPRANSGFTLLEILIVIVIVGVIIASMAIATGALGRDREMQDQAEKLAAVLTQAKEEVELQGFDVGLRLTEEGYDFLRFDSRKQVWEPLVGDDFFAARQLPAGLRFRLWLEGREVTLKPHLPVPTKTDAVAADAGKDDGAKADAKLGEEPKEEPPQIMVLSSGDVNVFKLQFERDGTDSAWQVFSKPDNSLVAEQVDDSI